MLPALLVAAGVFCVGMAAAYAPPDKGEVAVVFPIGTDEYTAYSTIQAAGGRFVAGSKFSNIVVAYAADAQFHDRVKELGGLFTLAAFGLCAPVEVERLTL